MRWTLAFSLMVVALATPLHGSAQLVTSFAELPLRINRADQVRVVDQSGARTTGRVVSFGRDGLSITTDNGERRFADESVRRVDRRGRSKAKGALVGAGVFAVLGAVACSKNETSGCEAWPVLDALFFGAPLGMLVGSWVPSMRPVYRAPVNRASATAPAGRGGKANLLEDLGMVVNLGDHVLVESSKGVRTEGSLRSLGEDAFTVENADDSELTPFARETVLQVSLRRGHARQGTLLGFVAGAIAGCAVSGGEECVDGAIMLGGMGAGVGAIIGAVIHTSTVVYPAKGTRVSLSPALYRGRPGLKATLRL